MNNKLEEFVDIQKKGIEPKCYKNENFYYYSLPDYDENHNPSMVTGNEIESNKFEIDTGSILISKLNPRIKRVWKVDNDKKHRSISSTEFVVLRTSSCDRDFIYYFLQSDYVYAQLESVAIGSTNSHVRFKPEFIYSIDVNFPKRTQQSKIAQILATCDEVLEKTEAAISKYQGIKQGMMQDLFTRGIDIKTGKLRPKYEDAPELYKESELGWIPKDWEVKRLEEFGEIFYGKDYKSNPQGDNVPIYGTGGIMGYTSKKLNEGPAVLSGRKGSINNPIYVEGDFWNVDTIFCIKLNDDYNIKWFYNQLKNRDLTKLNEATGVPSVSSTALYKLKFSCALKPEQDTISKRLETVDMKIKSELSTLYKYQKIKAGLMQDLLTGKIEVKVNEEQVEP